jgi:hypothetical protein
VTSGTASRPPRPPKNRTGLTGRCSRVIERTPATNGAWLSRSTTYRASWQAQNRVRSALMMSPSRPRVSDRHETANVNVSGFGAYLYHHSHKTLVTSSAIARLSRVRCRSGPFAWIQKGALTSQDGSVWYGTVRLDQLPQLITRVRFPSLARSVARSQRFPGSGPWRAVDRGLRLVWHATFVPLQRRLLSADVCCPGDIDNRCRAGHVRKGLRNHTTPLRSGVLEAERCVWRRVAHPHIASRVGIRTFGGTDDPRERAALPC